MVRCSHCHLIFEPEVPGLLPSCRACGAETVHLPEDLRMASPQLDEREPTLEFAPLSH
jgi:hypothetical protein